MTPELRGALRRLDRQFEVLRAMPEPIPRGERYRESIERVGRGAYLRVGRELCHVVEVHRYREDDGFTWHELELFGLETGETRYLEWERDDELEVALNGPKLSLRDVGVSADEVEQMSERESGSIRWDGRTYRYDDDYRATFVRGGSGETEPVYFYDFETQDERFCLTVEEWGDERSGYEYEVYASEYIEPEAVEILVPGEANAG